MKKNNFLKNNVTKIQSYFQTQNNSEKIKKIVIIIGLCGIILIAISHFMDRPTKEKPIQLSEKSTEEYRTALENSLQKLVTEIKGSGKTKVLVTIESDAEKIYATEHKKNSENTEDRNEGEIKKKSSNDSELHYITVKDSHGSEKALAITQLEPKIKGVVVVCEGGHNAAIQEKIISVVTTALNIPSNRVCVTS